MPSRARLFIFDIHIGFDVFRLEEGDSMVFPASVPHRYVNPTESTACALTIIVSDGIGLQGAGPATSSPHPMTKGDV
jgi:Cupin domain